MKGRVVVRLSVPQWEPQNNQIWHGIWIADENNAPRVSLAYCVLLYQAKIFVRVFHDFVIPQICVIYLVHKQLKLIKIISMKI